MDSGQMTKDMEWVRKEFPCTDVKVSEGKKEEGEGTRNEKAEREI